MKPIDRNLIGATEKDASKQLRLALADFGGRFAKTLPKIAAGSLHIEFKRCGRPNCRCRLGLLHGPYLSWHWREAGRQRKHYVPMRRLAEVLNEIERRRAEAVRPTEVNRMLKELGHV